MSLYIMTIILPYSHIVSLKIHSETCCRTCEDRFFGGSSRPRR